MLRVDDLHVSYGRIRAVAGVSFEVHDGKVVALLGPNGAGKSTTLRTISGLERPTSGAITFDGERLAGRAPSAIARAGIGHVPEGRGMLPELTVFENLRLATYAAPAEDYSFDDELARVLALFPILGERSRQAAGSLSGGEQQMLAIGRALVTRPKLLMVDELSLGLAPTVVDRLFEALREINAAGTSILLVEQYIDRALELADEAVVLSQGEVRIAGAAASLAADEAAIRATYFGGEPAAVRGRERTPFTVTTSVELRLPDRLLSSLERTAARGGASLEELVADALTRFAANGGNGHAEAKAASAALGRKRAAKPRGGGQKKDRDQNV